MVEVFNRTVAPVAGRCRIDAHLCFGNYKGHAVAPRRYAPLFPAFLDIAADEVHLEMAGREMAELEVDREGGGAARRRRRSGRRQELLGGDPRGDRRPGAAVPAICPGRPAGAWPRTAV